MVMVLEDLKNLASQGSNAKAADTFYAMGGPIAFAKGGHQGLFRWSW
jgi:hypothetical protein